MFLPNFLRTIIAIVFCIATAQAQVHFNYQKLLSQVDINPDTVLLQLNQVEKTHDISVFELNHLLALAYSHLGDFNKADSIISFSIKNLNFQSDSLFYIKFLQLQSNQKKNTDDFEGALIMMHKILAYANRKNLPLLAIETHKSIGELYRTTEYFEMGLYYLERGENMAKMLNPLPLKQLAQIYGRRAAIFMQDRSNLDSVEVLSKKVIKIAKQINDLNLEAIACNELGFLYCNIDNPQAEEYLRRAVSIWEQLGYKIYETNAKLNLSRQLEKVGKYQEVIDLLSNLLLLVENKNWQWEKGGVYDLLGRNYAHLKQYEKANYFTRKAKDHLLIVSENQYSKRLALLSTQMELKSREDEILRQQQVIELAKVEKNQLFLFLIFSLVGLILLIVLAILINNQRQKLKEQKLVIESNNKALTELINQKETLLKEVNHRVKNNLSVLSGLLYLQQKDLNNKEALNALKDSQIRITTIALIHESLYQRDDMEKVDFQDYLTRLFEYIKSIYWPTNKPVSITIRCKNLTLDLSKSIPLAMIINEFVTNSFKYAFEQVSTPELGVYYHEKNNEIVYFDNGPGIKETNTKATLGLKLVEIFSQQIEATVVTENKDGLFVKKVKFD